MSDSEAVILAFKAGRCHRREGTNWVDPDPRKGAICLVRNSDDELLHFQWRDRTTNEVVDVSTACV
jgi:26S proteasome regulatory subunit N13